MFKGFFDESNRDPAEVKFIMAGWTAKVDEWERFSQAWYECLSQKPAIEYFKTYEADNLSDQFYKLTHDDAAEKKLALAHVISQYRIRGYISTAAHTILDGRPKELRKMMGTRVYDWAFVALITKVLTDHLELGEREQIDFTFDGCSELRSCIESYEKMKEEWPPSMRELAGEVIPGDDRKLVALQSADLLAGEHSAYLRTGMKDTPYLALEIANIPVLSVEAAVPPMIDEFLEYSREVYERARIVHEAIKYLKEKGIKLDDF
jgi:hypothetical protein